MKKLIILALTIFVSHLYGQDISGCETVSLENSKIKEANECILKLSNYALSQPITGYSEEAHYSRKVVIAWVEATPDYSFSLNDEVMKLFKGDNLVLFNIYVCCLANAALTTNGDFYKAALGLLVEYVKEPNHKVSQTKRIKKLIKNWESDAVEKYIN